MHWHEGVRPGSQGGRGCVDVEAVVLLGDVGKDRDSAGLDDRLDGRNESCRGYDHHAAVLEPRCTQSEAEGIKPTGHTDAMRRSTVGGEGVLEARHVWPIRERSRLEESFD